ncbi:MAG: hypothetical protein V4537_07735 [Pseudomonadota bacterium]
MTGDLPPIAPEPAPSFVPQPAPARRGRGIWIVAGLAFVLGIVAMYFVLPVIESWRTSAQPVAQTAVARPAAATAQPTITAAAPITLEGLAGREAVLDTQLRDIEARIAATDAASRTAAGYARRAEGLMVAFAARRALDRGLQLGYVEGQLRERFSADQPQAMATVIAAAKDPVTLGDLREGLDRIAPQLTSGSTRDGFLTAAWREMSNLVVLRRESTPSPRPNDRLTRARRMLDAGHVEGVVAEVGRMPGAAEATSWIDAAKRYIDARRALNTLELAAINGRADPALPAPAAPASAPAAADPAAPVSAGQTPGI